MSKRTIGKSDLNVTPVGLGCMGMSWAYGPGMDHADGVKLIREAIEAGVDHLDTAEMYGSGDNEELVGKALKDDWRDKVTLATKFGPLMDPETGFPKGVDGSPENVRRASEGSLKRLGVDTIDLYYLHRMDPDTPIEDTVGEMSRLVEEGKVRFLGLSECSAETLRRAHAVHPIAAVQSEYSIFTRDLESGILPAMRDLGVGLVAYSPLGRGMLTGKYDQSEKPKGDDDFRALAQPRFEAENYEANLQLVDEIKAVADSHGALPAQVALAWVLSRGDDIVTIPGTTKFKHVETNLAAQKVSLSDDEITRLGQLADRVKGARYNSQGMASVNR